MKTPQTLGGAQRNFGFYKAFFSRGDALQEPLTANELEELWESAYVYRDRKGAGVIAQRIERKSRFWYSCFEALSAGSELKPAKLTMLTPSDIPEPRMVAFIHLFTLHELRSCPNEVVHVYVKLMIKVWDDARHQEELGPNSQPATFRDKLISIESPSYWKKKVGSTDQKKASSFENVLVMDKKLNAAGIAFEACAYHTGDEFLREGIGSITRRSNGQVQVGPWYSGDLPYLLYMSGHSLYRVGQRTLRTDDGRIVHLSPMADKGWTDFLLTLSKERDQIFELRKKSARGH